MRSSTAPRETPAGRSAATPSPGPRGGLSRVTLVGRHRRIDMVLPSEEPVGELLPEILRLLGERPGRTPVSRHLVTMDGSVLAQDDSLTSASVPDGSVLRLVREHETPAAPVVHDVTDDTADDLDLRNWRWGARSRVWTASTAAILLSLVTAQLARSWLGADAVGYWLLAPAGAAAVGGVLAARLGSREIGTALLLLGGVLGTFGTWAGGSDRPGVVGVATVLTLVLLGFFTALGRGGFVGAGAVAAVLGGWELAEHLLGGARTGVVIGVVSVLAVGFLPRLAMMTAGLTRLDDSRSSGSASVSRHRVDTALAAAHRGLALATVAVAGSAAVAGWVAVSDPTVWTVVLTVLLSVALFSQARAFPLAVESVALMGAGTLLVVRLITLWAEQPDQSAWAPVVALATVALLPLVLIGAGPPDHVRVRLRRLVNMLESVCVVGLVPLAIGAFGIYGRLLDTF